MRIDAVLKDLQNRRAEALKSEQWDLARSIQAEIDRTVFRSFDLFSSARVQ